MEAVHCQTQLLEVVAALEASRRFASRLDGGQQQRDQDADDRNDDQEFHQRKAATSPRPKFAVALIHRMAISL